MVSQEQLDNLVAKEQMVIRGRQAPQEPPDSLETGVRMEPLVSKVPQAPQDPRVSGVLQVIRGPLDLPGPVVPLDLKVLLEISVYLVIKVIGGPQAQMVNQETKVLKDHQGSQEIEGPQVYPDQQGLQGLWVLQDPWVTLVTPGNQATPDRLGA